jgi:hypothetical protein
MANILLYLIKDNKSQNRKISISPSILTYYVVLNIIYYSVIAF